jgi:hypothetical protein
MYIERFLKNIIGRITVMEAINIIAIIISPIVAVLITFWVNNRSSKRNDKMYVFKALLIHQNNPINPQRIESLNLVDVIFYKDSNITQQINKYKHFHDDLTASIGVSTPTIVTKKSVDLNDAYIKLLELIAANLGYREAMNWDNLKHNIIPKTFIQNDRTIWY